MLIKLNKNRQSIHLKFILLFLFAINEVKLSYECLFFHPQIFYESSAEFKKSTTRMIFQLEKKDNKIRVIYREIKQEIEN